MSDLIGIGVAMIGVAAVLWAVGELIGTVLRERARCKTIDAISGIVKELGAALNLVLNRGHERSRTPTPDERERETSSPFSPRPDVDLTKMTMSDRVAYIAGLPKETQEAIEAAPGARFELCIEHKHIKPCRICEGGK